MALSDDFYFSDDDDYPHDGEDYVTQAEFDTLADELAETRNNLSEVVSLLHDFLDKNVSREDAKEYLWQLYLSIEKIDLKKGNNSPKKDV